MLIPHLEPTTEDKLKDPKITLELLLDELEYQSSANSAAATLKPTSKSHSRWLKDRKSETGRIIKLIKAEILRRFEFLKGKNIELQNKVSDLRSQVNSLEDASPENH